jgi:hypothetical protein
VRYAVLVLVAAGCHVPALDITGKACPCPSPWTCDETTSTCMLGGSGSVDAPAPIRPIDAPPEPPALVATSKLTSTTQTTDVPIMTAKPGDVLIAGFTIHSAVEVASVVDGNGTPFVSANARAALGANSSDLWYLDEAKATTSVTITMAAATGYDVWIVEFSHVADAAPEVHAGCVVYPPSVEIAKVTTTAPNTLVFGTTMLAAPLDVDSAALPFIGLPVQSGNGAAYYVAAAAGSYGPAWSLGAGSGSSGNTCASTAAFGEAP